MIVSFDLTKLSPAVTFFQIRAMAQKENPKGWRENGNDRRSVESKSSASNATGDDAVAHRLTQLEELLVEAMVQIRELRERVQVLEERAAPPADQNQRLPELVEGSPTNRHHEPLPFFIDRSNASF